MSDTHPPAAAGVPERKIPVLTWKARRELVDTIDHLGPGERDAGTKTLGVLDSTWKWLGRMAKRFWPIAAFLAVVAVVLGWLAVTGIYGWFTGHIATIGDAFGMSGFGQSLKELLTALLPQADPAVEWQVMIAKAIAVAWFVLVLTWPLKALQGIWDLIRGNGKGNDQGFVQTGRAMVGVLIAVFVVGVFHLVAAAMRSVLGDLPWIQPLEFWLVALANFTVLLSIAIPIMYRYNGLDLKAKTMASRTGESLESVAGWLPWLGLAIAAVIGFGAWAIQKVPAVWQEQVPVAGVVGFFGTLLVFWPVLFTLAMLGLLVVFVKKIGQGQDTAKGLITAVFAGLILWSWVAYFWTPNVGDLRAFRKEVAALQTQVTQPTQTQATSAQVGTTEVEESEAETLKARTAPKASATPEICARLSPRSRQKAGCP